MSKNRMCERRSTIGVSLVAAAIAAFSFAPNALAAGGQNNNGSGQFSGGGGHGSVGFSGGAGFSSGGGFGGHSTGGIFGGGFARPAIGATEHFGASPAFRPGGIHISPSTTGGSSSGSIATHPFAPTGNPAWQNWNNGQFVGHHWNGFGNGNFFIYPYYFAFVPLYYGGYSYFNPYYTYGSPDAYFALYGGGDDVGQQVIVPQAVNPGPPIAAGANVPPANAVVQNGGGWAAIADADDADASAGAEFFSQAEAAFQEGRYRDALRLANHAAVESPRNPKAHELMSLSMFALADYRGAAIEAHAAIAMGPIADWATVFGYYGEQAKYTAQLRALEKYSHENPKSAEARFLRAYHYLMTGHTDAAKEQLAEAIRLTPNDKLAVDLLKKYSGNPAAPQPATGAAPKAPQNLPAKPETPDPDGFDT